MTFPDAQTYCFQFYLLMTQAFSLKAQNYDKIIDILNKELKRIDIWLKANKLTIHNLKNSLYDVLTVHALNVNNVLLLFAVIH